MVLITTLCVLRPVIAPVPLISLSPGRLTHVGVPMPSLSWRTLLGLCFTAGEGLAHPQMLAGLPWCLQLNNALACPRQVHVPSPAGGGFSWKPSLGMVLDIIKTDCAVPFPRRSILDLGLQRGLRAACPKRPWKFSPTWLCGRGGESAKPCFWELPRRYFRAKIGSLESVVKRLLEGFRGGWAH